MILPWKENDCWQMANPGCLRGFVVQSSWYVVFVSKCSRPPPLNEGLNLTLRPHTQTRQQYLDIRLLGNFLVGQVAGCKCTLLAGNSSISLAGSEEQINFSQQSPNMRKMASESFIRAFLLFLGIFLKISRWMLLYMQFFCL